jgi:hypothetical protein
VLARGDGGRRGARQPTLLGEDGGEQRRAVLRCHDAVGGDACELGEQGFRVELLERVEVAPRELDRVTLGEPGGRHLRDIALLWTDDENTLHVA